MLSIKKLLVSLLVQTVDHNYMYLIICVFWSLNGDMQLKPVPYMVLVWLPWSRNSRNLSLLWRMRCVVCVVGEDEVCMCGEEDEVCV